MKQLTRDSDFFINQIVEFIPPKHLKPFLVVNRRIQYLLVINRKRLIKFHKEIISEVESYDFRLRCLRNGKMIETHWEFYDNGHKKSELNKINGRKNGLELHWYENGIIMSEIGWNRDRLHGSIVVYNPKGSRISETYYYDGNLIHTIRFINGRPTLKENASGEITYLNDFTIK